MYPSSRGVVAFWLGVAGLGAGAGGRAAIVFLATEVAGATPGPRGAGRTGEGGGLAVLFAGAGSTAGRIDASVRARSSAVWASIFAASASARRAAALALSASASAASVFTRSAESRRSCSRRAAPSLVRRAGARTTVGWRATSAGRTVGTAGGGASGVDRASDLRIPPARSRTTWLCAISMRSPARIRISMCPSRSATRTSSR